MDSSDNSQQKYCDEEIQTIHVEVIKLLKESSIVLNEFLSNLYEFLSDLSNIGNEIAVSNKADKKCCDVALDLTKKSTGYIEHLNSEIPILLRTIKASDKRIKKYKADVISATKELDSLKRKLDEHDMKLKHMTDELSMQVTFTSQMGAILGSMLWRVSKNEDSIDTFIKTNTIYEFLLMTNVTMNSFMATYKNEMPLPESYEFKFLMSLIGITINISAHRNGRNCILNKDAGLTLFHNIFENLSRIQMPAGQLLKRMSLMCIYNLSICTQGARMINEYKNGIEIIISCLSLENTSEIQALTLSLLIALLDEVPSRNFLQQILKLTSSECFQSLSSINDDTVSIACNKLKTKVHQMKQNVDNCLSFENTSEIQALTLSLLIALLDEVPSRNFLQQILKLTSSECFQSLSSINDDTVSIACNKLKTKVHQMKQNVDNVKYHLKVFGFMLGLSALIGIYFGFISKKKQDNTVEYLLGGKTMSFLPVAASLIASHISGATFLAVPAEVYSFGSEYALSGISTVLLGVVVYYIYLPVFYDLQLTSSFKYLEIRFSRKIRLFVSFIYITADIMFMPVVIYVPALAFAQVSGISLHVIACVTSIFCIFYTTVGGLKAVVWTDTLQFVLMVGGLICVTVLGLMSTGGIQNVLKTSDDGGRLILFNLNPSPFVRTSFWTYTIGLTLSWISKHGISQSVIQRLLSVPNIETARKSVWVFVLGLTSIKLIACFGGLIIYTKFQSCDPVKSGGIQKIDQILPYFVMDVASKVPGLPGLFIAGIFSAALSSMSSSLNTVSGTIYEDFIRHNFPNNTEKTASNIMKVLVVLLGILTLSLVFVVEHMGQIFRLNYVIIGLFAGTHLGIFTIGMFSKSANTKGIICGAIGTLLVIGTIIVGSQSLPKEPPLPVRVDGCTNSFNVSLLTDNSVKVSTEDIPLIFRLSFMYYSFLGLILMFLISLPVSWMTGGCEEFDERLLTPFMRSKNWKIENEKEKNKKEILYDNLNLKEFNSINIHSKSDITFIRWSHLHVTLGGESTKMGKIRVFVIGCGMTKFEKPGRRQDFDYPDMAKEAVTKALADAKISYKEVKQAVVGYVYGDSTSGQRALYEVGMSGIPIYNVNNNCSTGSSALFLAKQLIENGQNDCIMALGFEKMERGSLSQKFTDRTSPMDKHFQVMSETVGFGSAPPTPQMFGNAGEEHMRLYGSKPEHFAKIAYKNHKHSVNNPYSQFQEEYTFEQIQKSPVIYKLLTKLQCCPTSDGSACCIVASEEFVRRHGLEAQAVEIVGMEMSTDFATTFSSKSSIKLVGYDMTRDATRKMFEKTNYKPQDVDVVELHDCFSANEMISYEALGLCPEGKGHEMVERNDNTYGGKYVVNPSGGLTSKGHPLGATGLAQCSELCWQLRGEAGKRQVQGAKLALQHNVGLGGAVVVGLYRLGFPGTRNPSAKL
ncbi:CLUMA_CG007919, isoform A [Clunio marinus]|uniref:propanoyl-CoA C-acyltransferase n=1 Tax=Clunio marinus TaxID=568069 RepID=A0A1J1I490_9DIPT|nr:CLUMA_CG007919, isoform A [Clunio marinus]